MDMLTFISSVVGAIAWPVLVLALALIALHKAPTLASLVKTVRYKELEITFQEAREQLAHTSLSVTVSQMPPLDPNDKVLRLAAIDTGAAISEIWRSLEVELQRLIQHSGQVRFTNPVKFVDALCSNGMITENEWEFFHSLRQLRNKSVHASPDDSPTIAEVIEFRNFVAAFSERLQAIRSDPEPVSVASIK